MVYSPKNRPVAAAATKAPLLRTREPAPLLEELVLEALVADDVDVAVAESMYSASPFPVQVRPSGQQP